MIAAKREEENINERKNRTVAQQPNSSWRKSELGAERGMGLNAVNRHPLSPMEMQ